MKTVRACVNGQTPLKVVTKKKGGGWWSEGLDAGGAGINGLSLQCKRGVQVKGKHKDLMVMMEG